MKTAEEYLMSVINNLKNAYPTENYHSDEEMRQTPEWKELIPHIEMAQKEAYNQAINDAAKNAELKFDEAGRMRVDKQSILKLLK